METTGKKPMLPNAIAVLVLGICTMIIPCVGFITGIVGWALSGTGMRIYRDNPTVWDGFPLLQAGRILSIVGTLLYVLWLIVVLILMTIAIMSPETITQWESAFPYWILD